MQVITCRLSFYTMNKKKQTLALYLEDYGMGSCCSRNSDLSFVSYPKDPNIFPYIEDITLSIGFNYSYYYTNTYTNRDWWTEGTYKPKYVFCENMLKMNN